MNFYIRLDLRNNEIWQELTQEYSAEIYVDDYDNLVKIYKICR